MTAREAGQEAVAPLEVSASGRALVCNIFIVQAVDDKGTAMLADSRACPGGG